MWHTSMHLYFPSGKMQVCLNNISLKSDFPFRVTGLNVTETRTSLICLPGCGLCVPKEKSKVKTKMFQWLCKFPFHLFRISRRVHMAVLRLNLFGYFCGKGLMVWTVIVVIWGKRTSPWIVLHLKSQHSENIWFGVFKGQILIYKKIFMSV